MKFFRQVIVLVCLSAVPGYAQDLSVDRDTVLACFADTDVGAVYPDCLGAASNACQEDEGGSTTIGIATCIAAETAVWDALLNEEYTRLRRNFGRQDAAGSGATADELLVALRDAQRAWIAFRDADCGLRYTVWQGGTIRSIVAANCHLTMTAGRALALRDLDRP